MAQFRASDQEFDVSTPVHSFRVFPDGVKKLECSVCGFSPLGEFGAAGLRDYLCWLDRPVCNGCLALGRCPADYWSQVAVLKNKFLVRELHPHDFGWALIWPDGRRSGLSTFEGICRLLESFTHARTVEAPEETDADDYEAESFY